MHGVRTFLWFDTQAEEAATFYTSIIDGGRITHVARYGDDDSQITEIDFELGDHRLTAFNGGASDYSFNESTSLLVRCDTQDELDRYWTQLTDGGEAGPCGWLKDRFGVSWQLFPTLWFELTRDPDRAKAQAVVAAMLKMGKIESDGLQAAYDSA